MEWWGNEWFNEYLKKLDEIEGMDTDRRWMLYQLLRLIEAVPGDTAECGVFKGASSYLLCKANSESKIHKQWHFLFDLFEWLSEPLTADGNHWRKGALTCGIEIVKDNLLEFENFSLHKG